MLRYEREDFSYFINIGNQVICLADTTSFTMIIRLDKTAAEICDMAKTRLRYGNHNDRYQLVEVKSNGGDAVFVNDLI